MSSHLFAHTLRDETAIVRTAGGGRTTLGVSGEKLPPQVEILQPKPRLGHKKAIIAAAAAKLRIIYHMLRDGTFYQNLGPDYRRARNPERDARSLANRIRSLGFVVEIKKAA